MSFTLVCLPRILPTNHTPSRTCRSLEFICSSSLASIIHFLCKNLREIKVAASTYPLIDQFYLLRHGNTLSLNSFFSSFYKEKKFKIQQIVLSSHPTTWIPSPPQYSKLSHKTSWSSFSTYVLTACRSESVMPIQKVDTSYISNCWPISRLYFLSKSLKRKVNSKLSLGFSQKFYKIQNQSGFKTAHSTKLLMFISWNSLQNPS